jgi:hypothetical protein
MIFGGTFSRILKFSQMTKRYRKIMNDSDIDTLQIDVDRLGDWAVENLIKINPGKSKAEHSGEGASKLYFWGPKNSRSKQLRIFRNNLMQRFKQG